MAGSTRPTPSSASARQHTKSDAELDALLERIQNDLFDLGADLATPEQNEKPEWEPLRVVDSQVERLEREIDAMNERLSPLTSFVLPAGSPASAALHVARTVCRRAERKLVELIGTSRARSSASRPCATSTACRTCCSSPPAAPTTTARPTCCGSRARRASPSSAHPGGRGMSGACGKPYFPRPIKNRPTFIAPSSSAFSSMVKASCFSLGRPQSRNRRTRTVLGPLGSNASAA
jgi:hypothetical protein